MTTVQIDLPEGVFSALHRDPQEMSEEMRKVAAVKWYEMGRISQERAAETAGVSRAEFLNLLAQFKVCPFQYTKEELEQEIANYSKKAGH